LRSQIFVGFIISIVIIVVSSSKSSDKVSVDQALVPIVTITDEELIEFFMYEFMIIEDSVEKIEIIDATMNGFGKDDLIKIYPSNQIHFLVPSDTAQKVMNSWEFEANFRKDATNEPPEVYEASTIQKAQNGILAFLLRGLKYNYKDLPMRLRLDRDSTGITFEMWGYNESMLQYTPPPPPVPDSVMTFDVVYIVKTDTLVIADTTFYDFMYVYKTVSDTVFMKPPY